MARSRTEEDGGATRVNKMDLVRQALASLGNDAMPGEIAKHIKDTAHVEMSSNMVSNYKSSILKKLGMSPRRRGRRRGAGSTVSSMAGGSTGDGIPLEDLRTIHEMAGRLGVDRLRELIELFH